MKGALAPLMGSPRKTSLRFVAEQVVGIAEIYLERPLSFAIALPAKQWRIPYRKHPALGARTNSIFGSIGIAPDRWQGQML